MADENTTKSGKDYYESKGMSRYTMILSTKHKDKLKEIADRYDVNQGAVIEVFLDNFDPNITGPQLDQKAKTSTKLGRPSKGPTKSSLTKLIKDMSPEQLAKAQEVIFGFKKSL